MARGHLGTPTRLVKTGKGRKAREPYVKASSVRVTRADGSQYTQGAYNPWELAKVRKNKAVPPKRRKAEPAR